MAMHFALLTVVAPRVFSFHCGDFSSGVMTGLLRRGVRVFLLGMAELVDERLSDGRRRGVS